MSIAEAKGLQEGQCAAPPSWTGIVRHLHITPRAFLPMESFKELTLVAGKGIVGDRYMIGQESGFYSHKPENGRQITLFEIETLDALLRDAKIRMLPEEHRRNVTVQGVPLNHLVGQRFWVGEALLEATRLSTPCRHIEEILGKAVFDPLINRAGLNCQILKGGVIRVGDVVRGA
ncbi:MAG: MOSC domain-containing protein [Pusillimonas sp.]